MLPTFWMHLFPSFYLPRWIWPWVILTKQGSPMLWLRVHHPQRVMPGRSPGQNLTPSHQMGNSPPGLQTQIMNPFPWGRPAHIHPGRGWHKRPAADGASRTCGAPAVVCTFCQRRHSSTLDLNPPWCGSERFPLTPCTPLVPPCPSQGIQATVLYVFPVPMEVFFHGSGLCNIPASAEQH